jgi:hypothetical protein
VIISGRHQRPLIIELEEDVRDGIIGRVERELSLAIEAGLYTRLRIRGIRDGEGPGHDLPGSTLRNMLPL